MRHKTFITFDEQVELLKSRGLIIDDNELAKNVLAEINYYRLSGYTLSLRKNDKFYPDVTFDNVLQIYNFDRELKLLILGYLEDVEVSLRSYIAYALGAYDTDANSSVSYLDVKHYASDAAFQEMMGEIRAAMSENKNEAFVKHHKAEYNGVLPVWAMVEILSFGKASKLLNSLNVDLQKKICREHYYGKRYTIITNWMEGIVVLRNLCAHRARLVNRGIIMKPDFSPDEIEYFKKQKYEGDQIGSRLFFRLIIIDRLSHRVGLHQQIKDDIIGLKSKYPFVDLKYYGFKRNWEEIFDAVNAPYYDK